MPLLSCIDEGNGTDLSKVTHPKISNRSGKGIISLLGLFLVCHIVQRPSSINPKVGVGRF